jgi:hypothetical protein
MLPQVRYDFFVLCFRSSSFGLLPDPMHVQSPSSSLYLAIFYDAVEQV